MAPYLLPDPICLALCLQSFLFKAIPIFEGKMSFLYTDQWAFSLNLFTNLCLLIGKLRPLVCKVTVERCVFVALMVLFLIFPVCVLSPVLYLRNFSFICFLSLVSWLYLFLSSTQDIASHFYILCWADLVDISSFGLFISWNDFLSLLKCGK